MTDDNYVRRVQDKMLERVDPLKTKLSKKNIIKRCPTCGRILPKY